MIYEGTRSQRDVELVKQQFEEIPLIEITSEMRVFVMEIGLRVEFIKNFFEVEKGTNFMVHLFLGPLKLDN
jgi:hypothetical protein